MADNGALALANAQDFEESFNRWFNAGFKATIDDSRRRYRMIHPRHKELTDANLSALPSTKSTEVVDKSKEAALLAYHKDDSGISYTSKALQNLESDQLSKWLTSIVKYRMTSACGFPFFTWHEASLKALYTDGIEAAFVYWRKEAYTDKRTLFADVAKGTAISKVDYDAIKAMYPDQPELYGLFPFDVAFTKTDIEEQVTVRDTWWITQLIPGQNILWDFNAPMLDVNLGQVCMVKLNMTLYEIMSYSEKGIFDKLTEEEIKPFLTNEVSGITDPTATIPQTNGDETIKQCNTAEIWIFWEKIGFRWQVSFSIHGKKLIAKRKPSDDVFFAGRRVNTIPVSIGYTDKMLHENVTRSLPQVIAPIEDQYQDHINNINDITKNIARGGRIRLEPGGDYDLNQILNGGAFQASQGDVEFIQYNPGIMEGLRASDMHSAAINSLVPSGVSPVNIAPKGTNKTLGVSQMIQQSTDTKRYVQLMVRNQTFFRRILWLIAQYTFAFETDETVLRIAASQVPDFNPPIIVGPDGQEHIDVSVLDFDIDVQITAGLGDMPDVEKFNNLMQFKSFCDSVGIVLDSMPLGQLGAALSGYSLQRFNPQPPKQPTPPPKLDSKLNVSVNWIELPMEVQVMLIEKWKNGEVATSTDIEGRLKEQMHNGSVGQAGFPAQDMTKGPVANAVSSGGQIGGMGGY